MATLKALQELSRVVEKHHAIVNACMVDFVTKDIFSVINPDLANELLEMSEAELQSLPQLFLGRGQGGFEDKEDKKRFPEVSEFARELSEHTLEALGVAVSRNDFLKNHLGCVDDGQDIMRFFDRFMSDKKMHEVGIQMITLFTPLNFFVRRCLKYVQWFG